MAVNLCNAADIPVNIVGLFKNKVVIMDESSKHKVLAVGESTDTGFTLIAANSISAVFQDNSGNFITIGMNNDISNSFQSTAKSSSSETVALNEHNQYIVNVNINNNTHNIPAIIDTGANFITLNSEIATSLGINYKQDTNKLDVATASENTNGYKIKLDTVKIGSIKLSDIDAIVIEGKEPAILLIGMSFLKSLDLLYSGDKLEMKLHHESNMTPGTGFDPPPTTPNTKQPPASNPSK